MADRKKKRKYRIMRFEEDYWAFHNNNILQEKENNWAILKKQSKKPFHFVVKLMVGLVLLTFAAAVVIEGVSATRDLNDRPTDTITPITES